MPEDNAFLVGCTGDSHYHNPNAAPKKTPYFNGEHGESEAIEFAKLQSQVVRPDHYSPIITVEHLNDDYSTEIVHAFFKGRDLMEEKTSLVVPENQWRGLVGIDGSISACKFSNKGPLVVFYDKDNREYFRVIFDVNAKTVRIIQTRMIESVTVVH